MDDLTKEYCDECDRELEAIDADCDQDGYFPIFEKCECGESE